MLWDIALAILSSLGRRYTHPASWFHPSFRGHWPYWFRRDNRGWPDLMLDHLQPIPDAETCLFTDGNKASVGGPWGGWRGAREFSQWNTMSVWAYEVLLSLTGSVWDASINGKLHEAFITTPRKNRPYFLPMRNVNVNHSMLFGSTIHLITERLMNAKVCNVLCYQVLDFLLLPRFWGSSWCQEIEQKSDARQMLNFWLQLQCHGAVTTNCFKNCPLHILSSTGFGDHSTSCFPTGTQLLFQSTLRTHWQPDGLDLQRLCTSIVCQLATTFGMAPEGSAG